MWVPCRDPPLGLPPSQVIWGWAHPGSFGGAHFASPRPEVPLGRASVHGSSLIGTSFLIVVTVMLYFQTVYWNCCCCLTNVRHLEQHSGVFSERRKGSYVPLDRLEQVRGANCLVRLNCFHATNISGELALELYSGEGLTRFDLVFLGEGWRILLFSVLDRFSLWLSLECLTFLPRTLFSFLVVVTPFQETACQSCLLPWLWPPRTQISLCAFWVPGQSPGQSFSLSLLKRWSFRIDPGPAL